MSRLDKLKEQHPDLNVSIIDIISSLDPTDSYKYTEFLVKNFKNENDYYTSNPDDFKTYVGVLLFGSNEIEILNEFERHSKANRIKNKDISKYNNFLELNSVVSEAKEIEDRKNLEKETLKIYEDDIWLILTPLTFEASKVYGANTKWCVTKDTYWDQYFTTHRLIYVLNKKLNIKIAFSRNFNLKKGSFQAWDQLDNEIDPMSIEFIPDALFLMIKNELQINKTTSDLSKNAKIKLTVNLPSGGTASLLYNEQTMDVNTTVTTTLDRPFDGNFSDSRVNRIIHLMSIYPTGTSPSYEGYEDFDELP